MKYKSRFKSVEAVTVDENTGHKSLNNSSTYFTMADEFDDVGSDYILTTPCGKRFYVDMILFEALFEEDK